MSEEAYLQAVRDDIRTTLDYRETECEVELGVLPPPLFGEVFVAVCPAAWDSASEGGADLWERIRIDVHVIQRAKLVPLDRQGKEFLLKNLSSLNARCRAIAKRINMRYEVMDAANELIQETTGDDAQQGFHHPLRWTGCTLPAVLDATAWGAKPESGAAIYRTVKFGEAERIQKADTAV